MPGAVVSHRCSAPASHKGTILLLTSLQFKNTGELGTTFSSKHLNEYLVISTRKHSNAGDLPVQRVTAFYICFTSFLNNKKCPISLLELLTYKGSLLAPNQQNFIIKIKVHQKTEQSSNILVLGGWGSFSNLFPSFSF